MNDHTGVSDDVIADTYAKSSLDVIVAGIVAAYVSNNPIRVEELPNLINTVRTALAAPAASQEPDVPTVDKPTPAQIKKSITHEHIISFEDGRRYKTLKRHLTMRGLTPEAYRAKWGLSPDYPMVSASYSEQRSELARALGLGQQRRAASKDTAGEPVKTAPAKPKPAKAAKEAVAA